MASYDTQEIKRGLWVNSFEEKFNKPNYHTRINNALKSRKNEKAKNKILSHPGIRDLFQYMYMVDYDGENLSKSYHSIPEEIKKKIELKVEEIVNDMLNLIKDNYKNYSYSEYKDTRFSYSKFEELFKQKFWDFYDKYEYWEIVCKIMFQEIARSFKVEELWDLERVRNIQNFIITDEGTRSLYEFYTEEQLRKKTYGMLKIIYYNQDDFIYENTINYSKFKDLFEKTFKKFYMVDPSWLEEICKIVFSEFWKNWG